MVSLSLFLSFFYIFLFIYVNCSLSPLPSPPPPLFLYSLQVWARRLLPHLSPLQRHHHGGCGLALAKVLSSSSSPLFPFFLLFPSPFLFLFLFVLFLLLVNEISNRIVAFDVPSLHFQRTPFERRYAHLIKKIRRAHPTVISFLLSSPLLFSSLFSSSFLMEKRGWPLGCSAWTVLTCIASSEQSSTKRAKGSSSGMPILLFFFSFFVYILYFISFCFVLFILSFSNWCCLPLSCFYLFITHHLSRRAGSLYEHGRNQSLIKLKVCITPPPLLLSSTLPSSHPPSLPPPPLPLHSPIIDYDWQTSYGDTEALVIAADHHPHRHRHGQSVLLLKLYVEREGGDEGGDEGEGEGTRRGRGRGEGEA